MCGTGERSLFVAKHSVAQYSKAQPRDTGHSTVHSSHLGKWVSLIITNSEHELIQTVIRVEKSSPFDISSLNVPVTETKSEVKHSKVLGKIL